MRILTKQNIIWYRPQQQELEPLEQPVFSVDWDGTCVENKWPEMGDWLPGAVDGLRELDKLGTVIIHTCRVAPMELDQSTPRPRSETLEAIEEIQEMLELEGLGHIEVWTRPFKPSALVYIDDKAIQFTQDKGSWGGWVQVLNEVHKRLELEPVVNIDSHGTWVMGRDDDVPRLMKNTEIHDASEIEPCAVRDPLCDWKDLGVSTGTVRQFESGATRDTDDGKLDYEGFLSPAVLERFGQYMHEHRHQSDGSLRDSDNWQKGIPLDAYMKSAFRHFMEWWICHRRREAGETVNEEYLEDALAAMFFNVQGYLHELLKEQRS